MLKCNFAFLKWSISFWNIPSLPTRIYSSYKKCSNIKRRKYLHNFNHLQIQFLHFLHLKSNYIMNYLFTILFIFPPSILKLLNHDVYIFTLFIQWEKVSNLLPTLFNPIPKSLPNPFPNFLFLIDLIKFINHLLLYYQLYLKNLIMMDLIQYLLT